MALIVIVWIISKGDTTWDETFQFGPEAFQFCNIGLCGFKFLKRTHLIKGLFEACSSTGIRPSEIQLLNEYVLPHNAHRHAIIHPQSFFSPEQLVLG